MMNTYTKKHTGIIIILLLILAFSWYMFVNIQKPKESAPSLKKTPAQALTKEDIVIGKGDIPKDGDKISVQYVGRLLDGRVFDSSYDRNQPFSFVLGAGEVIKGWDMGIQGMRVGGHRKLVIPPSLAYGSTAPPGSIIGPDATLVFEVTLVSIEK